MTEFENVFVKKAELNKFVTLLKINDVDYSDNSNNELYNDGNYPFSELENPFYGDGDPQLKLCQIKLEQKGNKVTTCSLAEFFHEIRNHFRELKYEILGNIYHFNKDEIKDYFQFIRMQIRPNKNSMFNEFNYEFNLSKWYKAIEKLEFQEGDFMLLLNNRWSEKNEKKCNFGGLKEQFYCFLIGYKEKSDDRLLGMYMGFGKALIFEILKYFREELEEILVIIYQKNIQEIREIALEYLSDVSCKNEKEKVNEATTLTKKRKSTNQRYTEYVNTYNLLTRDGKFSHNEAEKQICDKYKISSKTLNRAIKSI